MMTHVKPLFSQQTQKATSMDAPKKQFSMLVRVPTNYSSEQVKAAGATWDNLLQQWKDRGIYVISFAFPGESYTVSGAQKEVNPGSVVSDGLRVVSNIVLQASTMEEACNLAKDFPILKYGGSVEVREIPKPLHVTVH